MNDLKVHPIANIFPMMSDAEIADLAADIKANGLRYPIIIDDEEQIVDGRNRYQACKLAGVEPHLEKTNGADVLDLVVSLNVKRRNISASQRAVAAAEAWAYAEKEGLTAKEGRQGNSPRIGELIKDARKHFAKQFGVSRDYVEFARAVHRGDPSAFATVKTGTGSIKDAYDALAKREGTDLNKQSRLRKLAETRPDLAEQVSAETLKFEDAEQIAQQEEAERKQQRWAFTMNMLDAVKALERRADDAVKLVEMYDDAQARERGETLTPKRLRKAAEFVTALADAMEGSEQ